MNLQQVIERTDLASWLWIYAIPDSSSGKFTPESKVVDESTPNAKFFASKGFIDQFDELTEEKIEKINNKIAEQKDI